MKTIAVIGSVDTKHDEIGYMAKLIQDNGFHSFIIDTSGRNAERDYFPIDVTKEEVVGSIGVKWEDVEKMSKTDTIETMKKGLQTLLPKLYEEGKFDGVVTAGGLQNTYMARSALEKLPLGIPKVSVSSENAGIYCMSENDNLSDTVMLPTFLDIGGMNFIMKRYLENAVGAVIGMLQIGAKPIDFKKEKMIGITNLGISAKGALGAAKILQEKGYETCMFHGTMQGGPYLEQLIEQDAVYGAMYLCTHDIKLEAMGDYPPNRRPILFAAANKNIPTLIGLTGMDDIHMVSVKVDTARDVLASEEALKGRKVFMHNRTTFHAKVTKEEILKSGKLLCERVNAFKDHITVLIPLKGFRTEVQPGQSLYDPEVDQALIDYLRNHLAPHIKVVEIDANVNDPLYSEVAAREMLLLLEDK